MNIERTAQGSIDSCTVNYSTTSLLKWFVLKWVCPYFPIDGRTTFKAVIIFTASFWRCSAVNWTLRTFNMANTFSFMCLVLIFQKSLCSLLVWTHKSNEVVKQGDSHFKYFDNKISNKKREERISSKLFKNRRKTLVHKVFLSKY